MRAMVEVIHIAFSTGWSRGAPGSRLVHHGWGREKHWEGAGGEPPVENGQTRSGFDDSAAY